MMFCRKMFSPPPLSPKQHLPAQLVGESGPGNRGAFKTRCNLQIKRAQHSPMSLSPERSKPRYTLGPIFVLLR